jgi:aryl-alcohol dehydrogenase-like predicted oxidoreductase
MTSDTVAAAAAGTWKLGDLTVNRMGAAQVRLAWTLQRGPHVLVIPGTSDPAHLEANVAAAAFRLTGDEVALLEAVTIPA